MPKIVDGVAQKAEIRTAARRVFGRRGIKGTGLAAVADAAGMGRSSLYHYYPDKSSLVRDIARDLLESEEKLFRGVLESKGESTRRIEQLMTGMSHVFEAWSRNGSITLDLHTLRALDFRNFFRRIRQLLAEVIAEGQRDGSIDSNLDSVWTASFLIASMDGLLLQYLADRRAFDDIGGLETALVMSVRKVLAA